MKYITIKGPIVVRELIKILNDDHNYKIVYINKKIKLWFLNNEDIVKSIDELYNKFFPNDIAYKRYTKLIIIGMKNDKDIKFPKIKYVIKYNCWNKNLK